MFFSGPKDKVVLTEIKKLFLNEKKWAGWAKKEQIDFMIDYA